MPMKISAAIGLMVLAVFFTNAALNDFFIIPEKALRFVNRENNQPLEISSYILTFETKFDCIDSQCEKFRGKNSSSNDISGSPDHFKTLLACNQKHGLSESEILSRIEIKKVELESALSQLLESKLIQKVDDRFLKTDSHLRVPTRGPHPITRHFYKSTLKLAQLELDKTEPEAFEKRFITHISCSVNPKQIPLAKIRLAEALAEVRDILTEGECTDVYFLQAQLFSILK